MQHNKQSITNGEPLGPHMSDFSHKTNPHRYASGIQGDKLIYFT